MAKHDKCPHGKRMDQDCRACEKMEDVERHNAKRLADLLTALRPFAAIWLDAFSRMSDDAPIAAIGDNVITVGDVKAARAAIAKAKAADDTP